MDINEHFETFCNAVREQKGRFCNYLYKLKIFPEHCARYLVLTSSEQKILISLLILFFIGIGISVLYSAIDNPETATIILN